MTGADEQTAQQTRTLLVHLGTAMVATGQPINEVEDELARMKAQLGAGPAGSTQAIEGGNQAPVAQPMPNQTYAAPPGVPQQQPNQGDLR